jgi:hypothetical protein
MTQEHFPNLSSLNLQSTTSPPPLSKSSSSTPLWRTAMMKTQMIPHMNHHTIVSGKLIQMKTKLEKRTTPQCIQAQLWNTHTLPSIPSMPPLPHQSHLTHPLVAQLEARKAFTHPFMASTLYTSIREQLKQFGDPGINAVKQELEKLISKEVWTPILQSSLSPAERKKTISSQMFLKQKFKPDGTADKVKARLVAGGHLQDEPLYSNTASPTVETPHIFLEAKNQKKVATLDIGSAYLNALATNSSI